jgi:uncharacterized protein YoxC
MQMSIALQVALFLASVAIICLAVCIIAFGLEARRQLKELALAAQETKADVEILVQHSHELIRDVTDISKRVSQQLDEVEMVVRTVRQWTERVDRLVDEVGSAIEPPVFSAVRNLNAFRKGAAAFLQTLFHFNQHNQTNEQHINREERHVRE